MNPNFKRAQILYEQNRFGEAEKELKMALAVDPNNYEAHNLLTFILADQKKKDEALASAERTIKLAPDWDFAWYTFSYANWIQEKRGASEKALDAIDKAIRMEPEKADYYYLKGEIKFGKSEWQDALDLSDIAVSLDSEHVGALNLRAKSLVKLNRKSDANDTLDFAIRNDPENPNTHANKGWTLIERDDYDQALVHFKEALRLDPNNQWARSGLKNAIKGKNFLYRIILKYFLWISKLSEKNQWVFIIGAFLLYQGVLELSRSFPALAPLAYPIIIAYMVFAFSSWIAVPFSNLFLRLHPLGKHALSRFEIVGSTLIGIFMLGGIISGIIYFIIGNELFLLLAGWSLMMSLPIGGTFSHGNDFAAVRNLIYYTAGLGLVGLIGIGSLVIMNNGSLFNMCVTVFALGIFVFSFVANYLVIRRY